MAKITYPTTSPYYFTPQETWRLGRYVHRPVQPESDDTEIILDAKYQHRPDLLSFDLYQSAAYWWVFMLRNMNRVRDPVFDLKAGMRLNVPSIESIKRRFG